MNDESMMQIFGSDLSQGLPQGIPQGNLPTGSVGSMGQVSQEGSTWVHENLPYLNTFLSSQVGKNVNVGYIFGTGQTVERRGKLIGVGYNYIILQEEFTGDYVACDFYSIKFVRILKG